MTFSEIINLVKEFEGLIGGILGAVTGAIGTLVTTHILKTKGKIDVRLIDSNIKTYNYNDGWLNEDVALNEADGMEIEFVLEIYNNSETPKFLNNFRIELLGLNEEVLLKCITDSKESKRLGAGSMVYDSISYLNLEPKNLFKQGVHCSVDFENNICAKDYKKIVFSYNDIKEKKYSIIIQIR